MILTEILLIFSLFGELFLPVYPGATDTCFVSSTPTRECLLFNVCEGCICKAVDDIAVNSTKALENRDNVTMMFLPGVHNLTRNLTIMKKHLNLTMIGPQVNKVHIVLHQGSIVIQNLTKFKLSKLSIEGMSQYSVSIKQVLHVIIEEVIITGSALIIQCLQCNTVTVSNTQFVGSVLVIAWPDPYTFRDSQHHAYKIVRITDLVFHLSSVGNGYPVVMLIRQLSLTFQ